MVNVSRKTSLLTQYSDVREHLIDDLGWRLLVEDQLVSACEHACVEEDASVPGVHFVTEVVIEDLLVVQVDLGRDRVPVVNLCECFDVV